MGDGGSGGGGFGGIWTGEGWLGDEMALLTLGDWS